MTDADRIGSVEANAGAPPKTHKSAAPHQLRQSIRAEAPLLTDAERLSDRSPIGNNEFILMAKREGNLGTFYDRARTRPEPTLVTIDLANIRQCCVLTLTYVIEGTLRGAEARRLASELADGIVVMFYCKLRSVNYFNMTSYSRYLYKPVVPDPFEIPEPYALAAEQLGAFKVSGLPEQLYLLPTIADGSVGRFGLPPGTRWSPITYLQAVEHAKKVGLRFSGVDLSMKMGSSWWLYTPIEVAGHYELRCHFPEENFSEQTAALRNLFSVNTKGGYLAHIALVETLAQPCYGTMCRNLQDREDVLVYDAVVRVTPMLK